MFWLNFWSSIMEPAKVIWNSWNGIREILRVGSRKSRGVSWKGAGDLFSFYSIGEEGREPFFFCSIPRGESFAHNPQQFMISREGGKLMHSQHHTWAFFLPPLKIGSCGWLWIMFSSKVSSKKGRLFVFRWWTVNQKKEVQDPENPHRLLFSCCFLENHFGIPIAQRFSISEYCSWVT